MAYVSTTTGANGSLSEKITALLRNWKENAEKRRLYRQTYRELDMLSARELADLGLSRSMIRSVAYEASYNPQ